MRIEVAPCKNYCTTKAFYINGKIAESADFGGIYDVGTEFCGEGCGNGKFLPKDHTPEVLKKYRITPEEYAEVCKALDCLSYGRCTRCESGAQGASVDNATVLRAEAAG